MYELNRISSEYKKIKNVSSCTVWNDCIEVYYDNYIIDNETINLLISLSKNYKSYFIECTEYSTIVIIINF